MGKTVLNMPDLVTFIKDKKNITFNSVAEENRIKNILEKYNYLNIFSLKYLFGTGSNKVKLTGNRYRYEYIYGKQTKYRDIEKKYKELLKLENKIREGVLMYETELKSHFIFFLHDFLTKEGIDFNIFLNNLVIYNSGTSGFIPLISELKSINDEWGRQTDEYSMDYDNYCDYYHLFIKILSFGTVVRILDAHYNGTKVFKLFSNYLNRSTFNIGKTYKNLKTIIILRNSLCHKESLIIFLEKGYKKNEMKKLEYKQQGRILKEDFLQLRINSIVKIYEYYMQGKKKKMPMNCWVRNYFKNRLMNGQNGIKFKKIKINV